MVFQKIIYFIFNLILFCNINNAVYFSPNDNNIFTNNNPNSYFGLSVQLQNSQNLAENRILIGAPKYINDSGNETGMTYSCLVHSNKCNTIVLDVKDDLNDSWLGAQIDATSNAEGNLMTCAPRWVMRNFFQNRMYDRLAGLCYFIQEGNKYPIESENVTLSAGSEYQFEDNGYNYIFGQAGFSVHFSERTSSFIVGIPGLRNWTGSVMNVFEKEGKIVQNIVNAKRADLKVPTYAYFGYTVSSGKFTTGNSVQFVAGAPRANNLIGTVYIFEIGSVNDQPFRNRYELKGTTFGEYFGAAITVADINGDGMDDIIIGAPTYFTKNIADSGRVYVYLCKKNIKDTNKIQFAAARILNTTDTKFANARFGSAISSLGDINKDGYTDIVVGAPYYNKNGAIFIYLGSKQGLNENYNQIIKASEFQTNLRGFGYSLSKGVDIDGNKYNDVAVGAYLSGHVVLLKTRPVITLELDLSSNIEGININVKTFNIISCLKYHGVDVPSTVNIKLNITSPKTVILNGNSSNFHKAMTITNNKICETIAAEITLQTNDLDDVLLKMVVNIDEDTSKGFCPKCPIIDEKSPTSINHKIPFLSNCTNGSCKPDLIVTAKYLFDETKLAIGFKQEIGVQISIDNNGENAFLPIIVVNLPERVTLSKLLGTCEGTPRLNCTFTLGKVIEANSQNSELTIYLDITKLIKSDQNLSLDISVSSRGIDANPNTNQYTLTLPLYVHFSIYILGIAPSDLLEEKNTTTITSFAHQFDIQNIGFSALDDLEITIFLPQSNHLLIKEVKGCTDLHNETYQFTKDTIDTNLKIVDSDIEYVLACNKNQIHCTKITCKVHNLDKNDFKRITLDLEVNTLLLGKLDDKNISLYTIVKVASEYSNQIFWGKSMTTIIKPIIIASSIQWIVIGSILGFVGLFILVLILYKLKFFKRQSIESLDREQEKSLVELNLSANRSSRYSTKIVDNDFYGEKLDDSEWSEVSLRTSSKVHTEKKTFSKTSVTVSA